MFKKVIGIVIFLFSVGVYAQTKIDVSFNKTHTGLSYRLGGGYVFKEKMTIGAGIKIIQWTPIIDNQNHVLKNRFKPANLQEKIGVYATFDYLFLKPNKTIVPYISYDFSLSRSSLYNKGYYYLGDGITTSNDTIPLFTYYELNFKPVTAIEHHLSAGCNIKICKNVWLTEKIGGGIMQYFKLENSVIGEEHWELAWMANIGITYFFEKKK